MGKQKNLFWINTILQLLYPSLTPLKSDILEASLMKMPLDLYLNFIISILVQKYIQIIKDAEHEKPGSNNSTSNLLICNL